MNRATPIDTQVRPADAPGHEPRPTPIHLLPAAPRKSPAAPRVRTPGVPVSATAHIDPQVHAAIARATASLSPLSYALPVINWALHLAASPGKQLDLALLGATQFQRLQRYVRDALPVTASSRPAPCVERPAGDRRFEDEAWRAWPFNLAEQSWRLAEQWWQHATHDVWGVSPHHEDVVAFIARQWLSAFSPENYLATNPVAQRRTLEEGGANLVRGWRNLMEDVRRASLDEPAAGTEEFVVGRDVAATPGKVVYRNRLIELIQYAPTTPRVQAEPVLIVPAWIMKYYILDLSPGNSFIRHLVAHGHTVFCVSWKNPGAAERDLGLDDYLRLGVYDALDAIGAIVPERRVHAAGYCLGGTLLSIAAAALARDHDQRLASLTLLAAQTDFSEPGDLGLFIDDSAVSMLAAQMSHTGYLTGGQMAGAFQLLRSHDLLWARWMQDYVLGARRPLNDLMAWNADATRMPALMHSQYLQRLYLDNDLARGRYLVGDAPVLLNQIQVPLFVVGTAEDQVAPWESVYKIHNETVGEVTFVLTNGGHNAGIVSEPGHPRRHYQVRTRSPGDAPLTAEAWQATAARRDGSWWLEWEAWLDARSGANVAPPRLGNRKRGDAPLADAPGNYVMER